MTAKGNCCRCVPEGLPRLRMIDRQGEMVLEFIQNGHCQWSEFRDQGLFASIGHRRRFHVAEKLMEQLFGDRLWNRSHCSILVNLDEGMTVHRNRLDVVIEHLD